MWQDTLITPDTPIFRAIEIIDRTGLQIALVVNEQEQLLGTVTDGDIRRALLKQLSLNEAVTSAMNSSPCFVHSGQSRASTLTLMRNRKLHQIPVLDEEHRVVGLEIADELLTPPQRLNWVVLMAGGLGRRLSPLTDDCPKPLLKIGDRPVLETILEQCIGHGFGHFFISVNYKAEMIEQHFGDGSRWGVKIGYLRELQPLGTAGALGLLPRRPSEPLLLMNGDVLTKVNYSKLLDFHRQSTVAATICVKEQCSQIPYGVITIRHDRLQQIEEKPVQCHFINAGIYVLNPLVLDHIIPGDPLDIPDLFDTLIQAGREVAVFPVREYWADIGRIDDYERIRHEFSGVFR